LHVVKDRSKALEMKWYKDFKFGILDFKNIKICIKFEPAILLQRLEIYRLRGCELYS